MIRSKGATTAGLSPRVRGNRFQDIPTLEAQKIAVYPRECGGTTKSQSGTIVPKIRSIPASAGEPRSFG